MTLHRKKGLIQKPFVKVLLTSSKKIGPGIAAIEIPMIMLLMIFMIYEL